MSAAASLPALSTSALTVRTGSIVAICLALIQIKLAGPAPLQGPYDSSGFPVGCKSACEANIDGDPVSYYVSLIYSVV